MTMNDNNVDDALTRIEFQDLKFNMMPNGTLRATFLTRYYFDISKEVYTDRLGECKTDHGALLCDMDENRARKRLENIIDDGFNHLIHLLYNKPTIYIHQGSDIPLIGTNEFGLIDRGSNIIEVKPLTGCNFQCSYCSVDEGKNSKTHDYLVECEYLISEAKKIAATKEHPVEFNIGPQGEPLLYPKFVELVEGLHAIENCAVISVNTNGSLLTKKLIDDLAKAGLSRINLSLNALNQDIADELAGKKYPLENILSMIKYCEGKIAVLIAPTIVPGINDNEMDGLVQLSTTVEKRSWPTIGIQNYLVYPKGRSPVAERSFEEFYSMLKPLEGKYGTNLTVIHKEDFNIFDEPELEKPFFKNNLIRVKIAMPARYLNEIIGVSKDRCITIIGKDAHKLKIGSEVPVRIVRDKHNIFKGTL